MAQYKVPQNTQREDQIIGPFTLRQFLFILSGCMAGYMTYTLIGSFAGAGNGIMVGLIIAMAVSSFAVVKVQGMELPEYLAALIVFTTKPRKRVWQRDIYTSDIASLKPEVKDENQQEVDPTNVKSRLDQLAYILDTRGWGEMATTEATAETPAKPTPENVAPEEASINEQEKEDIEEVEYEQEQSAETMAKALSEKKEWMAQNKNGAKMPKPAAEMLDKIKALAEEANKLEAQEITEISQEIAQPKTKDMPEENKAPEAQETPVAPKAPTPAQKTPEPAPVVPTTPEKAAPPEIGQASTAKVTSKKTEAQEQTTQSTTTPEVPAPTPEAPAVPAAPKAPTPAQETPAPTPIAPTISPEEIAKATREEIAKAASEIKSEVKVEIQDKKREEIEKLLKIQERREGLIQQEMNKMEERLREELQKTFEKQSQEQIKQQKQTIKELKSTVQNIEKTAATAPEIKKVKKAEIRIAPIFKKPEIDMPVFDAVLENRITTPKTRVSNVNISVNESQLDDVLQKTEGPLSTEDLEEIGTAIIQKKKQHKNARIIKEDGLASY